MPRIHEGKLGPTDARFAVVVSRFNGVFSEQLLAGAPQMIALSVLDRSGRVVQDSRGAAPASAPWMWGPSTPCWKRGSGGSARPRRTSSSIFLPSSGW